MTIALASQPETKTSVQPSCPRSTPEEMVRISESPMLYELVDGHLVEKTMSDLAQFLANHLKRLLDQWSATTNAGCTFVETSYRCFPHSPDMVRRPDVSFISWQRLASYEWGHGHFTIAPDLAAEIVSPNDQVIELDQKIADYFQAGVRRDWVLNPELRIVRIHRAPGDISELIGDAELFDEQVLPGFRCHVADLFARPTAAPQPM